MLFADPNPLYPLAAEPVTDVSGVTVDRLRHEEEQAYYNDLYLLAPVGYFVVGLDHGILQANLVGAEMLGIPRATPQRHQLRSFISPAYLPDFDSFFSRALNSETPLQCRLLLQVGTRPPLQVTLLASADGSGQACRVVVERAEGKLAALERSEERFRRIVHSAEEGIWEIDAASITTFVNPKMAAMLGYDIEEMLDRPLVAFMDQEGRALLERNIGRRQQGIAERHEFKFISREAREVWTTMSTSPILDAAGNYLGALAMVTDITDRKASTEQIWQQANFDYLTGLPNRHMFMDRLRQETRKADRSAAFLALLFIDLDHFKEVNDQQGHAAGDALLVETTRRIGACVRSSDTLARMGGDEFTVILSGLDHVSSVERIAQSIIAALSKPFDLRGQRVLISASVGIALYPPDAKDLDELLARADQAMYASKNGGRNRFSYFTPDLQEAAQARQNMGADLRRAITAGQFEILYQPIVSLHTGAVHKAEALLRWHHPTRGLLGPAEFIPFAESNGMIVDIGDWVFREAARQAHAWQASIDPSFQVNVNKSPVQFRRDADMYDGWLTYLEQLGLPRQSIVIEITESVLMQGAEQVLARLQQYRAMGLQVALDDFGTGYSSLSHLKKFDIDYVKIDQSFVSQLETDDGDLALCEAIIAMAHKLGLKVVAEGVETPGQRQLLAEAGCDYAQGYVFAHPLPAGEFEEMARESRKALA
ncbi:putative bifunctional diguanylate cyclase/phosphodiesterase [Massilia cavernae]|uniref:EAL domain-containing protein n=1 Tax=Massilia cavernae TaxID=2320864 RepID=A0A418Y7K2_9BURK|nr:EAL domain-containing protein [Massilia cavernae]RJG25895.1 EAL domain-containing protein [Massilia cavernae]